MCYSDKKRDSVTEREVGKKGEKKGKGVEGKFSLELFVRITFPFPWKKHVHVVVCVHLFITEHNKFIQILHKVVAMGRYSYLTLSPSSVLL